MNFLSELYENILYSKHEIKQNELQVNEL